MRYLWLTHLIHWGFSPAAAAEQCRCRLAVPAVPQVAAADAHESPVLMLLKVEVGPGIGPAGAAWTPPGVLIPAPLPAAIPAAVLPPTASAGAPSIDAAIARAKASSSPSCRAGDHPHYDGALTDTGYCNAACSAACCVRR